MKEEHLDIILNKRFPEIKGIDRRYSIRKESMHVDCQIEHDVTYVPSYIRTLSFKEILEFK